MDPFYRRIIIEGMKARHQRAIHGREFLQSLQFTPKQLKQYDQRIEGIEFRLRGVLKRKKK